jgi:DNA-binding transcriptional MerR regulator
MDSGVHIGTAAKRLGVTPTHLRTLEKKGLIPPVRRDYNGRVYSEFDIALLKSLGVGDRPRKLKAPEEILAALS